MFVFVTCVSDASLSDNGIDAPTYISQQLVKAESQVADLQR